MGSSDLLLFDDTKPLPEAMLTYHQKVSCFIYLRAITHEAIINLIRNLGSDIALLKLLPQLHKLTA